MGVKHQCTYLLTSTETVRTIRAGRTSTSISSEVRSWMGVEVAVLGSPSQISPMVSVDVNHLDFNAAPELWASGVRWAQSCFTSAESVRTIRDVHLVFHTAPEMRASVLSFCPGHNHHGWLSVKNSFLPFVLFFLFFFFFFFLLFR